MTWDEVTLLEVEDLYIKGLLPGEIGQTLGLPYRVARHYVKLVSARMALPYVTVNRKEIGHDH